MQETGRGAIDYDLFTQWTGFKGVSTNWKNSPQRLLNYQSTFHSMYDASKNQIRLNIVSTFHWQRTMPQRNPHVQIADLASPIHGPHNWKNPDGRLKRYIPSILLNAGLG